MLVSELDEDGNKIFYKKEYTPSVFLPANTTTNYKSIDGRCLSEMTFGSYKDYKDFIETYADVPNFDIHGDIQSEYKFINKTYGTNNSYNISNIDIMYIDIETSSENGWPVIEDPQEEIIAITVFSTKHGKATFCLGTFTTTDDIKVFEYTEEKVLLKEFLEYFAKNYPDVVSGWNVRFFDFPYLIKRVKRVLGNKAAKMLSPWGILKEKFITRRGREDLMFDIVGIAMLDYLEVYKTFTYTNRESYRLDHIAYVELGQRKLSYDEHASMSDFYKKDFQKFIQYNIRDVELVHKLEEKLKLIELSISLAYSAGVNFQDVFSQVRTWDVIIYNYLSNNNIIIPPKKKKKKNEQYAGAYVKEPLTGAHSWIVSFDINSMYPMLMSQINISPETITADGVRGVFSPQDILCGDAVAAKTLEDNKKKNLSTAANGTTYRRDIRGFLPELMDKMYKDRKHFKNKMIESKKLLEDIDAELSTRDLTS